MKKAICFLIMLFLICLTCTGCIDTRTPEDIWNSLYSQEKVDAALNGDSYCTKCDKYIEGHVRICTYCGQYL